ncbi:MAG: Recombination protein RecR [Candidatus Peregrinibacteria bacterium GW2011_GWA2_47_7]|nr:MAG: Recombination protein RecR [Candidatus Peregrinibacteria bacterium GW2011_GWA2_47_7]
MLPRNLQNLIKELRRLPGVGPKSAERLSMYLLRSERAHVDDLARALTNLKEGIVLCGICWNISEEDPCRLCNDKSRDHTTICVVEESMDALAIERTREYKGLYHVLHGKLSPLNNISPADLKMQELYERLQKINGEPLQKLEVILAVNPDMEGEATALYIARLLKPLNIKISRIARGLPTGGHVEYADDATLTRALQGRTEY